MHASRLIAGNEAGELLLNVRGLSWLTAAALALSAFALLLVSNTELSLLDNAQVVYDMAAIITALGSLLALIVGIDGIAGERERGSLVPLLLVPAPRSALLLGKVGGIAVAWIALFVLGLPYLWAVGSTGQNLADALWTTALIGTPVVLGFGFLGMALGCLVASARTALMTGLLAFIVSASPLVLGPALRQSAVGHMFDLINPISAAVNAFDAVIIDSQGLVSQGWHICVAAVWLVLTLTFAQARFRRISG